MAVTTPKGALYSTYFHSFDGYFRSLHSLAQARPLSITQREENEKSGHERTGLASPTAECEHKNMGKIFLVLLILMGCSSTGEKQRAQNLLGESDLAIIKAGGYQVICREAYKEQCGVNLRKCSTGLHYMCQTNVIIFDWKTFEAEAQGTGAE